MYVDEPYLMSAHVRRRTCGQLEREHRRGDLAGRCIGNRSGGRLKEAISAQPLEKVKVRVGDDSDPSTFSFRRDRHKNSGPS